MTTKYLLPARRQMENRLSLAAAGFGLWIIFWNIVSDYNPIGWTGLDEGTRLTLAYVFVYGSVVHWFGVCLNGGHRWSPAYRVVGMLAVAAAFFSLAMHVPDFRSSAALVYGYFCYRFIQALTSAIGDLTQAIMGGGYGKRLG